MSNAVFPAVVRGLTFTVMKTPEFNTLVQESPNRYTTRIIQSPNPIWNYTLIYDYLKNFPNEDYALGLTYTDLQTMMGFFLARYGQADDFLFDDPDDDYVGPGVFDTSYAWAANFPFVLGYIIIDSNGNGQMVTTAPIMARSGGTVPTWNVTTGGTTADGGLTWTNLGLAPTGGHGGINNGVPNPRAQLQLINDGAGTYYSPIQRNMGSLFYEDITDFQPYTIHPDLDPTILGVFLAGVTQQPNNVNQIYTMVGPGWSIPGYSFMGWGIKWNNPTTNGTWAVGTGYALNKTILDPAGHIQKVTTAGTSGSTQPVWNDGGGTTPDGGTLVWTDQGYNPGPTGPVTAQFKFYFRVRFKTDQQDFEKFLQYVWTIGGSQGKGGKGNIELISSRTGLY